MFNRSLFSSIKMDYPTPKEFFNQLNKEFAFDLDPCASEENKKCERFFNEAQNGLKQPWNGRVFCNPPYGRVLGLWVQKAYNEVEGGGCPIAVMLIPSRTDTKYWHEYVMKAKEIRFVRGRLKFDGKNSAPFPSAVIVFKKGE